MPMLSDWSSCTIDRKFISTEQGISKGIKFSEFVLIYRVNFSCVYNRIHNYCTNLDSLALSKLASVILYLKVKTIVYILQTYS